MLTAVKNIGQLFGETKAKIEGKVLLINLSIKEGYCGLELEDFDSGKIKKYLFKEGASKGNVSSPFCPITETQKTYKKIVGWLEQCKNADFLKSDSKQDIKTFLEKIYEIISKNKDKIIEDINKKINEIPKKTSKFLTIKLDDKYLGEYDIFIKCFNHFEELKIKSSSSTSVCSICGVVDVEVSGKTDIFKFYTIDKPGFITGGFKKDKAWKNYPVCHECKIALEKGRKFVENNLTFRFYGLSYWLIPKVLGINDDLVEEILNILIDAPKRIELKERIKKRITNDENEILEYLSEKNDMLTLNLLFLYKQQSAERILLLIEDVLPSRLKKIFDAKSFVDNLFDNDFNFGKIREFFSKSDKNKANSDLDKYFLEIVYSVFCEKILSFSFLVKFFMAKIRYEFVNDGNFNTLIKDAFMDVLFFEKLKLLIFEEENMLEKGIFDGFFNQYGKSLNTSAKRGICLLGVLTQLLLNKQYSERGAKPFLKKLKGLKMNEKDIKALLPEVQNKLEEYDSFDKGKRELAQEISKYFLIAGDNWKMSVDEINFYFACGMNMYEEIANIVYEKNKEIKKQEE